MISMQIEFHGSESIELFLFSRTLKGNFVENVEVFNLLSISLAELMFQVLSLFITTSYKLFIKSQCNADGISEFLELFQFNPSVNEK